MTRQSYMGAAMAICFSICHSLTATSQEESCYINSIEISASRPFSESFSELSDDEVISVTDSTLLIVHASESFNYAVYYDVRTCLPASVFSISWTENKLSSTNFVKTSFKVDPLLPRGLRAQTSWYTNSGYNRGHMISAREKLFSRSQMQETFYLSNIAPQLEEFNAGCWLDIENYLCDTLLEDSSVDSILCVRGTNVLVCDTLQAIEGTPLRIPTLFFVYFKLCSSRSSSSLSFILPHPDTSNTHNWSRHQVTKDSIETTFKISLP